MIHYILELELCLVIDHCYPLKISTKDGVSMCKASFSMEIHGQCWTYNYKSQGCIIAIYIYIHLPRHNSKEHSANGEASSRTRVLEVGGIGCEAQHLPISTLWRLGNWSGWKQKLCRYPFLNQYIYIYMYVKIVHNFWTSKPWDNPMLGAHETIEQSARGSCNP